MGCVPVGREGARAPSEQCQGTPEQGTEPTIARKVPCDELVTRPGVDPPFAHMQLG